jgi:hypothetical protein
MRDCTVYVTALCTRSAFRDRALRMDFDANDSEGIGYL